jgi:hypothetical protein
MQSSSTQRSTLLSFASSCLALFFTSLLLLHVVRVRNYRSISRNWLRLIRATVVSPSDVAVRAQLYLACSSSPGLEVADTQC